MNQEILKKLLLNVLSELSDHQSCTGCNDLFYNQGLIAGATREELKYIG